MSQKKSTDEQEQKIPCKLCKEHYGSDTCLAPGEQGHGMPEPEQSEETARSKKSKASE